MRETDQLALLIDQDSYAKSLAEIGCHLNDEKRRYIDKVHQFVKEKLQEVWDSKAYKDTERLVAEDLLKKFVKVKWGLFELFRTLWVDPVDGILGVGRGPHGDYPRDFRGDFETHKVSIVVGRHSAISFRLSIEDELGLGVYFEDASTPIAYGPKDFAERVKKINGMWSKRDMTGQTGQAMIVLASEARELKFKPVKKTA